jgi:acetolactate synthase I/II/III large subunit
MPPAWRDVRWYGLVTGESGSRTTAALLADYLRLQGIKHVYGYPGESVVEFMDAAQAAGLKVVSAVREASAAFMAEGAAAATGTIAACLSTLGPGSTALLTGVASATLDRVPVLAISGQVEAAREQFFTHQVVDHDRLFAPVTKIAARLEADAADTIIRRAIRTATAERPGAVHLTVATDAWAREAGEATPVPFASPYVATDIYGNPVTELRNARRPVLLAGNGAVRCGASAALEALAVKAGIPVVVSPMAKGVLREDHPWFAGVLDMAGLRVIWELLAGADLIIAAGFDAVELISPWQIAAPVLHVDTTPNTDQIYRSDHEIVGNVAAALAWLAGEWQGGPRWTTAEVAAHSEALRAAWQDGYVPGKLNPSEVVTTVRAAAPGDTVMTTDVGSHKIMAGQAWAAPAPRSVLMSNGLSAMGFGIPAAIAASLERPGTPVVALTGDGGFAMTATELSVAAANGLPLTVVVFADGSLNRIELKQVSMGMAPAGTRVAGTDIPALAEALGCDGVRVDSVAALEKEVEVSPARGRPLVIEARIDPAQYFAQF